MQGFPQDSTSLRFGKSRARSGQELDAPQAGRDISRQSQGIWQQVVRKVRDQRDDDVLPASAKRNSLRSRERFPQRGVAPSVRQTLRELGQGFDTLSLTVDSTR